MEKRKTTISCTLIPVDEESSKVEIRLEATPNSMLNAFEQLSVAVINQLEEEGGANYAEAAYAVLQHEVIQQTCLKKGFEERTKNFKSAAALASILGKTFTMPEKKEEA